MNQAQHDAHEYAELANERDALLAENEALMKLDGERLSAILKMLDITHDMMKQRDAAKEQE